ncbi:MAG: tetratricopeptide repeat protein, partial [Arenicella sp.]|nr:tetratricopeptide repeat protein [Arenicella sp.]
MASFDWFWPALGLAFLLGYLAHRWRTEQRISRRSRQVSEEYFKGLNFLLNEQPDKAIEVFIKALEVDSETVELHLALGGLFRRKGQVDRATRIHQNLIARPNLTEGQRLEAIHELAQDYNKAGLLDRAENLYLELKESLEYRQQAIEGLCAIYQQEKDWQKAIDVMRLHKRGTRSANASRIAHYWCELARQHIDNAEYDEAQRCLKSALSENRGSARAVLLLGDMYFKQAEYRKALKQWQSLAVSNPKLAGLVVDKSIVSYRRLSDQQGLRDYLTNIATIPREAEAFNTWLQAIDDSFGEEAADRHIIEQIDQDGLSGAAANYLYQNSQRDRLSAAQLKELLQHVLVRAKSSKIE